MQELLQAIQMTGFPIVAWLITFLYMQKENQNHKEEVTELMKTLSDVRETMASLQQILEDKL